MSGSRPHNEEGFITDFPMLGVKETTDVGDLFRSNHVSPRFNKRIEKTPYPSTEMADDLSKFSEKRPPLRFARRGEGWRGDNGRSESTITRFIHNGFLSRGACEVSFALAILPLQVPPVGLSFWTLAVSESRSAAVLKIGKLSACIAAISVVAITG